MYHPQNLFKMSHIEVKACQLRDEAIKRINNTGFFKTWFCRSANYLEESIEYFKRAGNLFKLTKNWEQAANAFSNAADLSLKANNSIETAFNRVEAGNCFKMYDIARAIDCYQEAINLYMENGKFIIAARYYQLIAEIKEKESEIEEAVMFYQKAAVIYKGELSYSAANKCYEKIAEYAALQQDYLTAIKIFEEIAYFDLTSSVLKYTAKQYFFRAAICLLCVGMHITSKLQTYLNVYPGFEDTKEYKLILCLKNCLDDGDVEGFENAVRKFDSVSELSQWQVTVLLRPIKDISDQFVDMK